MKETLEIEAVERDGWLDIFAAAPEAYIQYSGIKRAQLGVAGALANPSIAIAEFNRVLFCGFDEHGAELALDQQITWLNSNAAASWTIQVPPNVGTGEVEELLARRGLCKSGPGWAKFHRAPTDLADVATGSLEIRQVHDGLAAAFGAVVQAGFGLPQDTAPWFANLVGRPGWHTYLAFDTDRPISAGAMFIRGGWAWLGIDASLSDARGRGGQSALIRRRLRDARSQGVIGLTAETGYPPVGQEHAAHSYRNYLKAGFELAYVRPNYRAPVIG
jgi:hypothetical protein